jgi:hypothetical protein
VFELSNTRASDFQYYLASRFAVEAAGEAGDLHVDPGRVEADSRLVRPGS